MTDEELRALVRDVVASRLHLHGRAADASSRPDPGPVRASTSEGWNAHTSHALYLTVVNSGDACVIEPAVRCSHCGYCKSHGY